MKRSIMRLATLLVAAVASTAGAQSAFPSKPITWVVPFPAGGGADGVTRAVANRFSQLIGQSVLVENRPGASGIIAAQYVKQTPADGHTIMSVEQSVMLYNPEFYSKLPYDPKADLIPVTNLISAPLVLAVHPSFPANDFVEWVQQARSQPGKFNYAAPGRGLTHHLGMEALKARLDLNIVEVQYKGIAPALQDVIAGQLPMVMADSVVGLPNLRAGKLRGLAVLADKRLAGAPDIPTIGELGQPGLDMAPIVGVAVARGTPPEIVAKLNAELVRAVRDPEVSKRLMALGLEIVGDSPTEFAAWLEREGNRWIPLIRKLNIKLE